MSRAEDDVIEKTLALSADGAAAYAAGTHPHKCPHEPGSWDEWRWQEGWVAAAMARRQTRTPPIVLEAIQAAAAALHSCMPVRAPFGLQQQGKRALELLRQAEATIKGGA